MMKIILRAEAVAALIDLYKVDLTDWLHVSYPDKAKQHLAVTVVELQLEIMTAAEKGAHCAERIAHLAPQWYSNTSALSSYAAEMERHAHLISELRKLRSLAIVPFRAQAGGADHAV